MGQRHSDLLYSVHLEGRTAYLYVLFEHQSTVDQLMAFRLLRYMVRIWDRWLAENPAEKKLPPIIPLVLYHGRSRWTAATRFSELVDISPEALLDCDFSCLDFGYLLNDLSQYEDEELRGAAMGRLTLLLLRSVHRRDFLTALLPRWAATLRQVMAESGLNGLRLVLQYILEAGEHVDAEVLGRFLATAVGPEAREVAMTAAQRLREEGRAEGRAEGRTALLLRQLRLRFGPLPEDMLQRVRAADEATLDIWAERILTAATLSEVLTE